MVREDSISPLQKARTSFQPKLPKNLQDFVSLAISENNSEQVLVDSSITSYFSKSLAQSRKLKFEKGNIIRKPLRVGVVLSGGQAAGGHNVIWGLHQSIVAIDSNSKLFGFLDGPKGLIENCYIELTEEKIYPYRNQGGFDLLGSGRTKIETDEQFQSVKKMAITMELDGIVIIGGDDSNTNAALLAEYFLQNGCSTSVVGVPKTIDGDLKNEDIEISFGFDTAVKTYSEIIGNVMRDSLSAKKYYYFIKLMGRSASHITLECALQTHPNIALIGEQVAKERKTLMKLIEEICDLICKRAENGKNYGIFLIPEGIIEFIPEFQKLILELNALSLDLDNKDSIEEKVAFLLQHLSKESLSCFKQFPAELHSQLLLEKDPHGNIQVSKIETERLFSQAVAKELLKRKKEGKYKGKFESQSLFCGYEGRSAMPSNFDAQYCYSLGFISAILIANKATGYICFIKNLNKPIDQWKPGARLLASMISLENRSGKQKPVIAKSLVDLSGKQFANFQSKIQKWSIEDEFRFPGPIQFFGPEEITDVLTNYVSCI